MIWNAVGISENLNKEMIGKKSWA